MYQWFSGRSKEREELTDPVAWTVDVRERERDNLLAWMVSSGIQLGGGVISG
jgi:hypothetical protein